MKHAILIRPHILTDVLFLIKGNGMDPLFNLAYRTTDIIF